MIDGKSKEQFAKEFLEQNFPDAEVKLLNAADYQLPLVDDTLLKVIDAIYYSDDDLDGTPNWRDELHGTHDGVDKIYLPDGTIIAEVNNDVWAHFRSNGEQYDGYYRRSLSGATTGDFAGSAEISSSGPSLSFSYSGPEGSYSFVQIPYPSEIVVEGSPY